MALVSGKPISFITELYSPRYIQRMMAELPEERAQAPMLYQGSVTTSNGSVSVTAAAPMAGLAGGLIDGQPQADRAQHFAMLKPRVKSKAISESALAEMASTNELADLFEYHIAQPVTIKKNESAMLPFLQDKIKARKVEIYSDESSAHPLNAAELVNSTTKTLDGGPITVYDGGGYVGEALVETVKANDKRLISYGVDLGTRITNKIDSEEREEREIHLARGVLNIRAATVKETSYSINNLDAKAKTLIIEHPLNGEFQVLNQKPSETTATARRFEMKLAPSATVSFPVIEEKVEMETQGIANLSPDVLVQYVGNKHLSEAGRRDIGQIVELKRQMVANGSDAQATKGRIDSISQDEERVRKNLQSFNSVSGQQELVQKYAAELAQLERQIAGLRDHQSELTTQQVELQATLDDRMEKMAF
jgi:predicted transcriptional regulator